MTPTARRPHELVGRNACRPARHAARVRTSRARASARRGRRLPRGEGAPRRRSTTNGALPVSRPPPGSTARPIEGRLLTSGELSLLLELLDRGPHQRPLAGEFKVEVEAKGSG